MTELDVVVKQIDEKVEQLKEVLVTGNFGSFEEYKKACGEIRGLLIARGYALDLKDKLENSDE